MKQKLTEEVKKSARPGWHTPPISKDMIQSFRREFKTSNIKNESPSLERYSNSPKNSIEKHQPRGRRDKYEQEQQ